MGTYNEAGELPLAIRLESTGDFTELYINRDRLICPVDIADSDIMGSEILLDALVRCAVFAIRSRREDMVDFLLMVSSKQAENAPERLIEWSDHDRIKTALNTRLQELKATGLLREDTDTEAVVPRVLAQVGIEYTRRRHGHLGNDALWGRELNAVKVLEDAGIDGSDLSGALANLAAHAAGQHIRKRKGGTVFNRNDAMLMIRDYQRRARIQRAGVRVIDLIFIDKAENDSQFLPRNPGWKAAVDPKAIKREIFESAVKWARLAAMKSGRGLLPIFFFTGEEGSGRSYLLKQVAWQLYKEGFPVAEIVDLEEAAKEAEGLATAAVALDAPLILVWDDAMGPGYDGIHALKEFSDAQLSGVPMIILAAASETGYNPKKIRQISRTSFEEFEIHGLDDAELERIAGFVANPVEEETPVGISDRESDPSNADDDNEPVRTEEGAAHSETDQSVEAIPEEATEELSISLQKLQEQKTDELTIMVSRPEGLPKITMLEGMIRIRRDQFLNEYAVQMKSMVTGIVGHAHPVFDLMCSWNVLGIPLPQKVATVICGEQMVTEFRTILTAHQELDIRQEIQSDGIIWDCGHPVLVRAMLEDISHISNGFAVNLEKSIQCVLNDPDLQPLTGRLMRSLYHSDVVPATIVDALTGKLITLIASRDVKVTPLVLGDLFLLASSLENDMFQTAVVDALADSARLNTVDSYIALTPLLRNRLGGIEDAETLEILNAAKPDIDRVAFKFLLKFLGDHQPNELREQSVDNARTAAARAPDNGFAVAAYLRFCWSRGTDEQILRSIEETKTWLSATPDDRVVRRAFIDFVVSKGSDELRQESIEPLEDWLAEHVDEGPLRNNLMELAFSVNDPAVGDRVLEQIAHWIEKRGNNRLVRQNYFRRAEKRNDPVIMKRACDVAVSWLNNHSDDRETVRSLLFIATRLGDAGSSAAVLSAINTWISTHVLERDILRRYLMLADRGGRGRSISHAVEVGLKWIEDHPVDQEIREIVLGMSARKVDHKLQVRVYDSNIRWLESLETPDPSLEYMIGRLGVRAGIARRAIPLLERTVAKTDGELRNHARLWLGSAYRVAEAYMEAQKVWEAVREEGSTEMTVRAQRNLESLTQHLKEKYPNGYPPQDERPVRKRYPQRVSPPAGSTDRDASKTAESREHQGAARGADGERSHRSQGPRPRPEGAERPDFRQDRPKPVRRPDGDKRPPKRFRDKDVKGSQRTEPAKKTGATLGDLFRMKGFDLSNLTGTKDESETSDQS